ncbi:MAG: WD40 repeat protein [Bacillariaceae sp.]|jgi:WD40 repeat protein
MSSLNRIPKKRRSIFYNTVAREYGFCGNDSFERGVSRFFHDKQLLQDPDIVSPHRKSISSLAMDSSFRFILAGSADATVSIYDISKWGSTSSSMNSNNNINNNRQQSSSGGDNIRNYHPVAKSIKVPYIPTLPTGHSSSVTYTQWYPTDAGVFLSASSDGTILVWDTSQMKPVMRVQPFIKENSTAAWVSAHLRTGGDYSLIAAGSWYESEISLVDIRSGACTHQLVGHSNGISTLKWSPTNNNIVASGSRDATVRLWDIRKSGSRACVTVLDREQVGSSTNFSSSATSPLNSTRVGGYSSDYSHLRREPISSSRNKHGHKKRRCEESLAGVAPNNYDHIQRQGSKSHRAGHVSGLEFFSSGHYLCSVGGLDGELLLWDLRSGCLLPSKFQAPGNLPAGLPKQRWTALCVEGSGYTDSCNKSSTIWIGRKDRIYGFSTEGGTPKQTLKGHLTNVTSLERMKLGNKLLSGSSDGMILGWGQPQSALSGEGTALNMSQEDKDQW